MSERILRSRTIQLQAATKTPGKRNRRAQSVANERNVFAKDGNSSNAVNPAKRSRRAISTITKSSLKQSANALCSSKEKMTELSAKDSASGNQQNASGPAKRNPIVAAKLKKDAGKISIFIYCYESFNNIENPLIIPNVRQLLVTTFYEHCVTLLAFFVCDSFFWLY